MPPIRLTEKDIILESITDGVFTVNLDWRITSFNRAAETITGVTRDEAIGQICSYVFRSTLCGSDCLLRKTMLSGEPLSNRGGYLLRGDGSRVPISVSTALLREADGTVIGGVEIFRDLSTVETLRRKITGSYTFSDIISRNHRMREIFSILPAIAQSPSTVLVEGESGTGKELVCRAIHTLSPRRNRPFVAINCGALPDTLLESELFGYKRGAFTDARTDKPGKFAAAEGGTILLDEIGDVSPALQIRLLRLLQERVYEPLGGTETVAADVRVLAATNRDIDELVHEGTMRSDLYYRLNVVRLNIPPLRDRKEDIPLLTQHFIERFNRLHGRDIQGISDDAMACLIAHDYPGNIRELENALEHAFVLCGGALILPTHLPEQIGRINGRPSHDTRLTMREIEKIAIEEAIRRNGGNKSAAARELAIGRSTLERKVKEYDIETIAPIAPE